MNSFKPGDWVKLKYKSYTKPYEILEIVNGLIRLNTELTPSSDNLWREDECMPWQPKVGEWVWSKGSYTQAFIFKWTSAHEQAGIMNYTNYEPFIGQLPTYLKDQS